MSNLHATFLAFLVIGNVWAAAGRWWEAWTWLAFATVALVASIVVARRGPSAIHIDPASGRGCGRR